MTAPLASRVVDALSTNGYLTTAALAAQFRVGRDRIAAVLDDIEAAGIRLHRTRGLDGGAELDEAAQPEPGDVPALLAASWPAKPVVRACSGIAGMPARRVPGQVAFLAKRMRHRRDDAESLARVAARLVELGVMPASEIEGMAR